jgi:hypothetical protein
MKLIPMAAAVLAVALTLANAASAAPGPLPAPPADSGPTANTIFDAMLSIARAAGSNPAAAQQATFNYDAAIQQFNARDFERARMSALTAIGQTAVPPLPAPSIVAPPIPQPSFYTMPMVANADAADAESYVALARRSTTQCGAPNAAPAAAVQQQFTAAIAALVARNYGRAEADSQSVVDQCSAATTAYSAQQAALPQPSATPIPMTPYSPLPFATLGPDPALQRTSH